MYANVEQKREYHRGYQKRWQPANRAKTKEYADRYRRAHPEYGLFHSAKVRARLKGLPFTLQLSDIVIPRVCPVLGIPLVINVGCGKRNQPNSPSLDRIIPHLGYVPSNVRVISWRANDLKKDATVAELEAVLLYLKDK